MAKKLLLTRFYLDKLKTPILKALVNEDTLLRTHCCRDKCFSVCPREQHLLRTRKMFLILFRNLFVSATNVSHFARPKKHHGQQCVRDNVSSFARAFTCKCTHYIMQISYLYASDFPARQTSRNNKH